MSKIAIRTPTMTDIRTNTIESGITQLTTLLASHFGLSFTLHTKDAECEEYHGYSGQLNEVAITFRKAKITPKKIGQFVTLWKRNAQQITTPYTLMDPFSFYIILTQQEEQWGCFLFPREVLGKKHVLTTSDKEGKRGFRVYPDWDQPNNKQAIATQKWQTAYFINLTHLDSMAIEKAKNILQKALPSSR